MRRTAALALVLAALAGCDGGGGGDRRERDPSAGTAVTPERTPAAATAPDPTHAERLRALVARRAQALAGGRVRAYAATSTARRRARDRAAVRSAAALPLSHVDIATGVPEIDGRRARVPVQISYELRRVRGEFSASRTLNARRRGGRWRIAGERGGRLAPWELGPQRLTRAGAFSILAPPDLDPGVAALPAELESARRAVAERLPGDPLAPGLLVEIAPTEEAAAAITGGIAGVDRLTAITEAVVRTSGPAQRVSDVVALRLIVVWPRYLLADAAARRRVLVHELTHAALAASTSGRTPAWLQEGIALHVSGDRRVATAAALLAGHAIPGLVGGRARAARRGLALAGLSAPDAVARLRGDAQAAAYAYSAAAVEYIAERHGDRRLRRLYRAFGNPALTQPAGPRLAGAAVRRVLGRGLRALERDLRGWILERGA